MMCFFRRYFRKVPSMITSKDTVDGFENGKVTPFASFICSRYLSTKTIDDEFEYDIKHADIPSFVDDQYHESKLRPLVLEIDLLRQVNVNSAPEKLSIAQWKILSEIQSKSDRIKFYKSVIAERKTQKSNENLSALKPTTIYENNGDSLFLDITDSRINRYLNYKLILAELFGPTLIVDCDYENQIEPHLLNSQINGLLNVWFLNREANNPFHIVYCNVDEYGELFRRLCDKFYKDVDLKYMLNISHDDYTDLFPLTQLVYLTPSSKCDIGKFNGKDILIMGGFVDDISKDFSALIVCKKEKLRHAKFPIDKFTKWSGKNRNEMLTSEEFIRIINDVKNGVSWSHALRHIDEGRMKRSIRHENKNQRVQRFSMRVFHEVK